VPVDLHRCLVFVHRWRARAGIHVARLRVAELVDLTHTFPFPLCLRNQIANNHSRDVCFPTAAWLCTVGGPAPLSGWYTVG